MIFAAVIESPPKNRMEADFQRVIRRYALFLAIFCLAVVLLWAFGSEIFALLLQKSRAYIPPQFLTWLSLASSLCLAATFCVLPFSLFRIVRQRSDVPFGWRATGRGARPTYAMVAGEFPSLGGSVGALLV